MSDFELARRDTDAIVSKIKTYFSEELGQEIGSFEAEFLVEFLLKEVGPPIYNRGVADAYALFLEKSEEMGYLVQELEKPCP